MRRPADAASGFGENCQHRVDVWNQRVQLCFASFLRDEQGRCAGLDARTGGCVGAARRAGGCAGSRIFPLRPDHLGFRAEQGTRREAAGQSAHGPNGKTGRTRRHDRLSGVVRLRLHDRTGTDPGRRLSFVVNRRVLTLWDLVVYGVVLIQPIAPVGIFGVALKISNGHAVTTILIAMVAMMLTAVRYLLHQSGWAGVFSPQPFYNPATFDLRAVMTATSLAALTYIGFDGVTTLAEETQNPRRTIPLATVLVCLITGIFSAVEVYLGQRVWPDYQSFPNLETAFLDVTHRVGGVL